VELKAHQTAAAAAAEQVAALQRELVELRRTAGASGDALRDSQRARDAALAEVAHLRRELEAKGREAEARVAELQAKIRTQDGEIVSLEGVNELVERHNEELEGIIRALGLTTSTGGASPAAPAPAAAGAGAPSAPAAAAGSPRVAPYVGALDKARAEAALEAVKRSHTRASQLQGLPADAATREAYLEALFRASLEETQLPVAIKLFNMGFSLRSSIAAARRFSDVGDAVSWLATNQHQ
jgi:chromosome segregation ATPase